MLIALIALLLVALSGCGKKPDKAEPRASALTAGGKISVGSAIEPETWNPLISELAAVQDVGRLVFAGLALQNEKGEWIPDLAQEVPTQTNGGISADGLTWTYRLKRDLKWQDGQPITAQDIRFTYDFILKNRQLVPWRDGYEKILSVNVVDNATVVLRFAEPYPHAIQLFSFVLPAHRGADLADVRQQNFNRLPVGAGPYILKEWRQGDSLLFVANPLYHRGKPNLDEISYKIVPDRQIVLSQLKIGEVDLVNNIAFDQLEQLLSVTGVNTFLTRGVVWEHLDFNIDNPLFSDVRVRQAISFAIDRTALIEKILKNAGFPAYTDIHPLSWAYGANLTFPARNLPHARELLAAAGWRAAADGILAKEGRRMSFLLTLPAGERFRQQVADALAGQLREIGVEMRLQPVERKQFFADVLPNRRFAAANFAWVNSTEPDNYDFWHSRRIPSPINRFSGKNYAGWKSVEVDVLLDSLRLGGHLESKRENYRRLQELLLTEVPVIPLYYRADVAAAKRSVEFFKPNPFSGNFWNVWEWGLR
jgi:peptide/nickel transport system substrate-binding protein